MPGPVAVGVQSSIRVVRESGGLLSSYRRAKETSSRLVSTPESNSIVNQLFFSLKSFINTVSPSIDVLPSAAPKLQQAS